MIDRADTLSRIILGGQSVPFLKIATRPSEPVEVILDANCTFSGTGYTAQTQYKVEAFGPLGFQAKEAPAGVCRGSHSEMSVRREASEGLPFCSRTGRLAVRREG